MSTCLVHNCETSQRLFYFYLLSPLSYNQIPFDPHQCCNNKTKDWASKIDCIIQAIKAMAELKEKTKELVRMADIINNTMADAKTGILLAGEGYHTDIATQFYKVAKTLRLILHNALPQ